MHYGFCICATDDAILVGGEGPQALQYATLIR
jgi:hypothetical protein